MRSYRLSRIMFTYMYHIRQSSRSAIGVVFLRGARHGSYRKNFPSWRKPIRGNTFGRLAMRYLAPGIWQTRRSMSIRIVMTNIRTIMTMSLLWNDFQSLTWVGLSRDIDFQSKCTDFESAPFSRLKPKSRLSAAAHTMDFQSIVVDWQAT